jgi:hypothetical protein
MAVPKQYSPSTAKVNRFRVKSMLDQRRLLCRSCSRNPKREQACHWLSSAAKFLVWKGVKWIIFHYEEMARIWDSMSRTQRQSGLDSPNSFFPTRLPFGGRVGFSDYESLYRIPKQTIRMATANQRGFRMLEACFT